MLQHVIRGAKDYPRVPVPQRHSVSNETMYGSIMSFARLEPARLCSVDVDREIIRRLKLCNPYR